ncbi:unnamed protein product [Owenia fusiformis]|uniref:STING ligand-binding domain-containing protein n=1 Tax=Owenia fusiformis TaxID=6347 RepID=A0A8J1UYX3_OWEFU|nr:unnamed protein product [Owenia fusiformis]
MEGAGEVNVGGDIHGDNVQVGNRNVQIIIQGVKNHIGDVHAANYFYAHLEIIITHGLLNKIENYIEDKHLQERGIRMAKKLYIFVPKYGKCPRLISTVDPNMKKKDCIEFEADYAGAPRPYKNTVWEFEKNDQSYQVVAEYGTILNALTRMPTLEIEEIEKITRKFRSALQIFINNLGEAGQFVELVDINNPSEMRSESDILKEKIDDNF